MPRSLTSPLSSRRSKKQAPTPPTSPSPVSPSPSSSAKKPLRRMRRERSPRSLASPTAPTSQALSSSSPSPSRSSSRSGFASRFRGAISSTSPRRSNSSPFPRTPSRRQASAKKYVSDDDASTSSQSTLNSSRSNRSNVLVGAPSRERTVPLSVLAKGRAASKGVALSSSSSHSLRSASSHSSRNSSSHSMRNTSSHSMRRASTCSEVEPPKNTKRVRFSTIEVREFPMTLGMGPALRGAPIGLDWKPQHTYTKKLATVDIRSFRRRDTRASGVRTAAAAAVAALGDSIHDNDSDSDSDDTDDSDDSAEFEYDYDGRTISYGRTSASNVRSTASCRSSPERPLRRLSPQKRTAILLEMGFTKMEIHEATLVSGYCVQQRLETQLYDKLDRVTQRQQQQKFMEQRQYHQQHHQQQRHQYSPHPSMMSPPGVRTSFFPPIFSPPRESRRMDMKMAMNMNMHLKMDMDMDLTSFSSTAASF